jgi:hypothetical protein
VRARSHSCVDPLIFFLDRSVGKRIVADALRQAGAAVEVRDDRIHYRVHERTALFHAGVRAFVLVRRSLSGPAMAGAFVRALPAMRRFVERYEAPFIARVAQTGSVSLLLTP